MIGKTVSHYRIIAELGAGGMGVVYKAEDTRLGRTVALKFLSRDLTSDPGAKERFLREARAIAAIDHPNICTIHEVDEAPDGTTFICMSCYEGCSLKEKLRGGPLPVAEAIDIATGVARGLAAAHAAGIVHRDMKPGNIMLAGPGAARIIDFGLAKLASTTSITAAGTALGTIAYMSPEQARGEETDARTDIWSLGVVLYEMVAGRRPFAGDHDQAILHSILAAQPEPLCRTRPGVPPELSAIAAKALEKNPAGRYAHVGAMLEDLRTLTRVLDASAGTTRRVWAFTNLKERAALRWVGVAALCVAAAAVAWSVLRGAAPSPLPSGHPLRVTSGPGWEGQPSLSPDGTRAAYVSDESGNYDVYVADIGGGNALRLTDDPAMDFSPTWFPDGTALAFASMRGGATGVWRVGQFGGGATLLVENATSPAISPDGSRIAFARAGPLGWTRIHMADLSSPSSASPCTSDEDGLWHHEGPTWSPDGRTLCYSARHNLWTVPADGGAPRPLTDVGAGDTNPAWSSDGRHIYFSSSRGGTSALWRVSRRGGEPERLTTGAGFEGEPSVSRDGSRLAYSSSTTETALFLADRGSGGLREFPTLKGVSMAAFVPGTEKSVCVSTLWADRAELAEVDLAAGTTRAPRRLTDQPGDASHPAVSPDGAWIAYYRIVGQERDIWILPTGGGKPVRLVDDPASDIHPAWSPDGKSLAFVSDRGGKWEIWTVPVSEGRATGEPRKVTQGIVGAYAPSWSPDGAEIAFVGVDDREVWTVPADGSAPESRLTEGCGAVRVRWDAAGELLASALNGADRISLWSVPRGGGPMAAAASNVFFGPAYVPEVEAFFDVSRDGNLILFQRQELKGDVWVLEAEKGTY